MENASVKDIVVKVIPAGVAVPFVKAHHYSGKVVNNSQLHFGAFLGGTLHGVMSYGPSMDKRRVIGLVRDTKWNEFIELNRMAFDECLPRNSESRCIGISLRLIRKHAPQIKWVVSFADGCQCGDGTIYRASNFVLTGITANRSIMEFPNGMRFADMTLDGHFDSESVRRLCRDLGVEPRAYGKRWQEFGGHYITGYMLRYVYFIDPTARQRLTVPEIPFSRIDEIGAGLYKGKKMTRAERHGDDGAQRSEFNRHDPSVEGHPVVG